MVSCELIESMCACVRRNSILRFSKIPVLFAIPFTPRPASGYAALTFSAKSSLTQTSSSML